MPQCYNKIFLKDKNIEVECGKCLNCLENRKREAVTRFLCDTQDYKNKYFITLTYDPLKLDISDYDANGLTKLNKKHVKAYREALVYLHKRHYLEDYTLEGKKMKWVEAGEYGETATKRAHYHLVLATNIFIERYIKTKWKWGNVKMERIKSAAAVAYTTGYTDKKYGDKKTKREIGPYVRWSRGLGKRWIHEAVASGKVSEKRYFAENVLYKAKLPRFFKSEYKAIVMGVKPKYRVLKPYERELLKEKGIDRKTIMVNQNEYDANYWKWEEKVNIIKAEAEKRDFLNLYYEELKKSDGDNWKQRVYNLMYNEKWDEMNEIERTFTELKKRMNEQLKIEAEAKEYRNKWKRNKIA